MKSSSVHCIAKSICITSSRLAKVVRVAHRAHKLSCHLWVTVGSGLPVCVRDPGGERVRELGAEAEVGVEEVEEETEGALLDQVGDEPARAMIWCH